MPHTVKGNPAGAELFGLEEAEQSWTVQRRCNTDIAEEFLRCSPSLVKIPGSNSSQAWICVVIEGTSFSPL